MPNNLLVCFFKKKSRFRKGFTVIELISVIAFILVFSFVAIANFPQIREQFSLSRVAYKFAQDVRKSQSMALSSVEYKDESGTFQPVKGYGVYADSSSASNKKYIIYADKEPGNGQYDELDYIVEIIDFSESEKGIILKDIYNIVGTNASVNFSPPNPVTNITPFPDQNTIYFVFALEKNLSKQKIVSINTSGLIQVLPNNFEPPINQIVCSSNEQCGADGPVGDPFCQGNNVYQNYITYICNNPGTVNSNCTNFTQSQLVQTCNPNFNISWQNVSPPSAPVASWQSVASNFSGSRLIAASSSLTSPGRIYLSSTFGQLWIQANIPGSNEANWKSVASNHDGSRLIAASSPGPTPGRIYISSDFGQTWQQVIPLGINNANWRAVASDDSGIRLVAASGPGPTPGRLYKSQDAGQSWTEIHPLGVSDAEWTSVALNGPGLKIFAVSKSGPTPGRVYVSNDFGNSWTMINPLGVPNVNWEIISSDQMGLNLLLGSSSGPTIGKSYRSSNGGLSWVENTLPGTFEGDWQAADLNHDGSRLIVGARSAIGIEPHTLYISSDFGNNWQKTFPEISPMPTVGAVSSNQDGSHLMLGTLPGTDPGHLFVSFTPACSNGVCTGS